MVVRYLLDAAFVQHDRALLDRIAIGLILLFSAQAVLNYVQAYLLSAVGEQAVAGLRREVFARLLEMPPGFFADRRTGELTSRLSVDIGLLQTVLSHQISEFARQILVLVGGVVLLTLLQPRLTLTALAVAPVVVGTALFFGRRLRRMTTGVQDRVAEATAVAEEAFSQIRTVQSFVQEPAERDRYGERIAASVRTRSACANPRCLLRDAHLLHVRRHRVRALAGRAAGAGGEADRRSAGFLPSVHDHHRHIHRRARNIVQQLSGGGGRGGAGVRDPRDVARIADTPSPVKLSGPVRGAVEFDDPVLPLPARPIGAVDARGRSTLGQAGRGGGAGRPLGRGQDDARVVVAALLGSDRGRILLDGVDIRSLAAGGPSRQPSGIVPQEPVLFSGSIRENIAYARPGCVGRRCGGRGAGRPCPRVYRAAATALRHDRR